MEIICKIISPIQNVWRSNLPDSPHKRAVFNGATSNRFTYKTYGEKGIAGNVFSTGKQPLAPLELIYFFLMAC